MLTGMRVIPVVCGIAAICLAYSVYEPLPDYVQDRALLYTLHAIRHLMLHFGKLLSLTGCCSIESVGQSLFSRLVPEPKNTSSVTFRYRQFADSRTIVATPADKSDSSGAAVIYIHGGGFVAGAPEMYGEFMKELVNELGVTVFGIRYRLAPKHLFPAGFNDAAAAVEAIFDEAESMGIDPSRIAIGGDSAGGQLTAAIVQHLRARQSRHRPKAEVLVYPVVQFANMLTSSCLANAHAPFLKTAECPKLLSLHLTGSKSSESIFATNSHATPKVQAAYLAAVGEEVPVEVDEETRRRYGSLLESKILDYRLSPLLNPDIDRLDLPPTLVIACEFDPIRDDALMYARRLERAGVKVELKKYQTYHAAMNFPNDGKQIRHQFIQYLKSHL